MTVCFHQILQVGLGCKMSPGKLVILSAIRRPPYKTTVAPNIYITACYVYCELVQT